MKFENLINDYDDSPEVFIPDIPAITPPPSCKPRESLINRLERWLSAIFGWLFSLIFWLIIASAVLSAIFGDN